MTAVTDSSDHMGPRNRQRPHPIDTASADWKETYGEYRDEMLRRGYAPISEASWKRRRKRKAAARARQQEVEKCKALRVSWENIKRRIRFTAGPWEPEGTERLNTIFLRALAHGIPTTDVRLMTAGFRGDPHLVERTEWAATAWHTGHGTKHLRENDNNYVVISAFGLDEETQRYNRRKRNFRHLLAVMVDDIGPKVPMSKIMLPLSGLIETSPGNCQGWYLIRQSAGSQDFGTADRLIKGMIASGLTADGTDPGMSGVTRYGRLPCGVNAKAKYVEALGHPFQVRIADWTPGRRYTVEEIAKAFKISLAPPPPRKFVPVPEGEMLSRSASFNALMRIISDAGLYLCTNGDWHEIVCPWVHEHTDGATTGTALCEPSEGNGWYGGFKCHHGHCAERTTGDLYKWKLAYESLKKARA